MAIYGPIYMALYGHIALDPGAKHGLTTSRKAHAPGAASRSASPPVAAWLPASSHPLGTLVSERKPPFLIYFC